MDGRFNNSFPRNSAGKLLKFSTSCGTLQLPFWIGAGRCQGDNAAILMSKEVSFFTLNPDFRVLS